MPTKTEKRFVVDCRQTPSLNNCSLTIAGREDEVLTVAVRHAVEEHGHADTPALHKQIKASLQEEKAPAARRTQARAKTARRAARSGR